MTDVIITLAISRDVLLTSNQRLNHYEKARRTRAVRDMAHILCKHEYRHVKLDRTRLTVTTRWQDKRRRDVDNIQPTVKAAVDGCVDAGLLPDDNRVVLQATTYKIGDTVNDMPGVACWIYLSFEGGA